jgi:hypothetical protein
MKKPRCFVACNCYEFGEHCEITRGQALDKCNGCELYFENVLDHEEEVNNEKSN